MIKLIALDMDGTVLGPDHTISLQNKDAIIAAQKQGVEVIIATGRGYLDAVIAVHDADLQLPFICLNGAEWRNAIGHNIGKCSIAVQDVSKILAVLDKYSIHYDMFINDYMYTKDKEIQIEMFMTFAPFLTAEKENTIRAEIEKRLELGLVKEVKSYNQIVKEHIDSVYKVLALSTREEAMLVAKQELDQIEGIIVTSSGKGNLEINHRAAQKGIALEKYANNKGVSTGEMMVVGDSFNDISMMKIAGYAVAMGNAPKEIKQFCHTVTDTNENHGVAKAIEAVLADKIV